MLTVGESEWRAYGTCNYSASLKFCWNKMLGRKEKPERKRRPRLRTGQPLRCAGRVGAGSQLLALPSWHLRARVTCAHLRPRRTTAACARAQDPHYCPCPAGCPPRHRLHDLGHVTPHTAPWFSPLTNRSRWLAALWGFFQPRCCHDISRILSGKHGTFLQGA